MDEIEITLPKLGESILSAQVVTWFKEEGDLVKLDEPLLEVSTDKVNSEIPSPVSGVLVKKIVENEQEVEVGKPLALISTKESLVASSSKSSDLHEKNEVPSEISGSETSYQAPNSSHEETSSMKAFFSPAVLRLAREKGLDLVELEKIPATGNGGRVTKKDVENYLAGTRPKKNQCPLESGVERLKMTGIRKAIADNMVKSFYEAPHATLVTEVDVTAIMKLIKKEKENFKDTHGCKISITSFIAKAIASGVQEFPIINSSLDGDTILLKRNVNLGIAVSVDQGIQVPVIKNCHAKTIVEIAHGVADLSHKARNNRLMPDDVKEGTITMTNFGMSGTLIGIPIIRYPEVAIIGIGAISKKVVALDDETMAIRSIMHVSLTFDHRALDGMYGCGFLESVKNHLESDLSLDS